MICPRIKSKLFFSLIIVFCIILPHKIFSQTDYGLAQDWQWEDLTDKAVLINPRLIKTVDNLRNEITISDARFLVKQISLLGSAAGLKNLYLYGEGEMTGKTGKVDSLIRSAFENPDPENLTELEELFNVMNKLIALKKKILSENKFEFKDREYLPQPVKEIKRNIEIEFDYSDAESILNYYEGNAEYRAEFFAQEDLVFKISDKYKSRMYEKGLRNILTESSYDMPVNLIYNWIYPENIYDFGGVFIYRDKFRNTINSVKKNENNIRFDIEKKILKYLPTGLQLRYRIVFTFGDSKFIRTNGRDEVCVSLEYFGDNYSYLVRFITHEIYLKSLNEIQICDEAYTAGSKYTEFVSLISRIHENGITNYVAPLGSETRPWDLLEKDFQLFNFTCKNISGKSSRTVTDSLIKEGFSGNAPFYTMGTQMAYIIETTSGRSSLIKSISLGPVSFFSNFIKAYREYPDKIRKVFTFSKGVESEISRLNKIFPEEILNEALKLEIYRKDKTALNNRISAFINKYKSFPDQGLLYYLSGRILLNAGYYENAEENYLKGLEHSGGKSRYAGEIGKLFELRNADREALKFFNIYVKEYPDDPVSYELRGEYYLKINDTENSLKDFQKAIELNPLSEISKENILRINK